jgi:hypothetical protein
MSLLAYNLSAEQRSTHPEVTGEDKAPVITLRGQGNLFTNVYE